MRRVVWLSWLIIALGLVVKLGDPTRVSLVLEGPHAGSHFGNSLEIADLNGDGYGDLVVGARLFNAPGGRTGAGACFIFWGGPDNEAWLVDERAPDVAIYGERTAAELCGSMYNSMNAIAAGDLNNDGVADLVLGSPDFGWYGGLNDSHGRVYVIFGQTNWPNVIDLAEVDRSDIGIVSFTAKARDFLGEALAVGDIDADGISDLVMAAPRAMPKGRYEAGSVYVVFGGTHLSEQEDVLLAAPPAGLPMLEIMGAPGLLLGSALAVGLLDADEVADLAVGSKNADGDPWRGDGVEGLVLVIKGSAALSQQEVLDLALQPPDLLLLGERELDLFGYDVDIGDLDGDGQPDLVVGAPAADGPAGSGVGEVFAFRGPLPLDAQVWDMATRVPAAELTIWGPEGGVDQSWLGEAVAVEARSLLVSGRQVNGCPNRAACGERGASYQFNQPPLQGEEINLARQSAAVTYVGEQARDFAGVAVAGNLDAGLGLDVVIGADWAPSEGGRGKVYVVLDRAGTPPATQVFPEASPTPGVTATTTPYHRATPTVLPSPSPLPETFEWFLPLVKR